MTSWAALTARSDQERRDLSEAATASVKADEVLTDDESESVSGSVLTSEDLGADAVT
jgi:hypothetical protein